MATYSNNIEIKGTYLLNDSSTTSILLDADHYAEVYIYHYPNSGAVSGTSTGIVKQEYIIAGGQAIAPSNDGAGTFTIAMGNLNFTFPSGPSTGTNNVYVIVKGNG